MQKTKEHLKIFGYWYARVFTHRKRYMKVYFNNSFNNMKVLFYALVWIYENRRFKHIHAKHYITSVRERS